MKKWVLLSTFLILAGNVAFASGVTPKNEPPAQAGATPTASVEIFVTSWCPYCRKLESFLKANNVSYTRYDVEADAKGAEIFDKIGGTGVPVTRIGNEVIHGYDIDRITVALKKRA